jgi:hypothetical protein
MNRRTRLPARVVVVAVVSILLTSGATALADIGHPRNTGFTTSLIYDDSRSDRAPGAQLGIDDTITNTSGASEDFSVSFTIDSVSGDSSTVYTSGTTNQTIGVGSYWDYTSTWSPMSQCGQGTGCQAGLYTLTVSVVETSPSSQEQDDVASFEVAVTYSDTTSPDSDTCYVTFHKPWGSQVGNFLYIKGYSYITGCYTPAGDPVPFHDASITSKLMRGPNATYSNASYVSGSSNTTTGSGWSLKGYTNSILCELVFNNTYNWTHGDVSGHVTNGGNYFSHSGHSNYLHIGPSVCPLW